MSTYIGIDLGGTNVRVAKITGDGEVLEEIRSASFAQSGPIKVMDNVLSLIRKISDYDSCLGIGIGVPGPVDTRLGMMNMSTNLPGFEQFPMAKTITDAIGLPCYVDNDANVAGLAEAMVGAGKGRGVVYYITQSTGIGGALIVNQHVVSGRHGYAGEIGNIIIDRNRLKYNHLNIGAAENEASGTAIARKGRELIGEQIHSAKDVFDAARDHDAQALQILDHMAYDLAVMCSSIAHVCDPDIFVFGGGVTKSADLYFERMKMYYLNLVHVGMREIDFEMALLAEPGIVGAAMLAVSNGR